MPNLQRGFRFETRQYLWHNIKAVIRQHNQRPFRLSPYARAVVDELNRKLSHKHHSAHL